MLTFMTEVVPYEKKVIQCLLQFVLTHIITLILHELVSKSLQCGDDALIIFIWRTFYVDTQMRFTLLYG